MPKPVKPAEPAKENPVAQRARVLGSEEEAGSVLFILFIPSKTKDGDDLPDGEDQGVWANTAGDVLAEQFGGSTAMPGAKGKWLNDDGEIISEDVIIVHSYASPARADDPTRLHELAGFLHRMGKRTDQGEVGVVIDGVFYKIRKFPLADEESAE